MRTSRRDGTQSSRTALAAGVATVTGAVLLVLTFHRGGCTDAFCPGATAVAFESVSISSWTIRWQEGCNSCAASLTPALAGVVLFALGVLWLTRSVVAEDPGPTGAD
ncbi:hypothetical protein G9C85_06590 [Halorubellus sp. JP-L1]|uniref:hypothetical protein n=1 Tax=Halorubellus sp. JP-L1 TaxID=2715753 RepID=UPI001408FA0F|nr:hypothetical protein [Halorubellus sp. JP-L1]NHN41303.1 hypothetical protein [Halorubellus sp. JP-L1]